MIVLVLLIGAAYDQWRLDRAQPAPPVPATTSGTAPDPGRVSDQGSLPAPTPAPAPASTPTVDLNRATVTELDRLPGIGPVLASRIVAHREHHGPFRDPAELIAVPGIGPALAARLAPFVTVSAPPHR